ALHPRRDPNILAVIPASQRTNWTRTLNRIISVPFSIVRLDAPDPEFASDQNISFLPKGASLPLNSGRGTVVIVGYEE
ncbi:hypothetical protein, partial [Serratia marcescens]|uniref:hypothetical protein n=1 Tax=Serratia marcescens TaxID=615 RepID=UPI001953424F